MSRLTYATNKCGEAVNACNGAPPELRQQFILAYERARDAHPTAKKDNDLIYSEKVHGPRLGLGLG